MSLVMR